MIALLLILSVSGCRKSNRSEIDSGTEFVVANEGEPISIDPHNIASIPGARIYPALFEGLLRYDPRTGEGVPGLAETWEISENRTVYTFKLRKAVWSDGTPITAETVKYSWLRMLHPETASPSVWLPATVIKGAADYALGSSGMDSVAVEAKDGETVRVELVEPVPFFENLLPHHAFAVVPLHTIQEYGDKWTQPENVVGNGPFVLQEWIPKEKLTVVRNSTYWDSETVQLDRVSFLTIDDPGRGYSLFLEGVVDWVTSIPSDQYTEIRDRAAYHVNPRLATYYLVIQNTKKPFNNILVRKALSLALDTTELVNRIIGEGEIASGGIVPPMSGYTEIEVSECDPEKARAVLAEAGYPGGNGFPVVSFLYNATEDQEHERIAEFICEQWKTHLGIRCIPEGHEWETYLAARRTGQFELARAGWAGDYQDPTTFLDIFISDTAMNDARYSNHEYDELLRKASTMPCGPERMNVLSDAEQLLIVRDQAIIPLYHYVNKNLIDTDTWGGWYDNVSDYHPFYSIYKK